MSLLAATAAEQAEKLAACGPPGKQAWLCSTVYDITGSQRAAEVGDDLALPLRILVTLLIAYLLVRIARVVVRRVVRKMQQEGTGEKISKLKHTFQWCDGNPLLIDFTDPGWQAAAAEVWGS